MHALQLQATMLHLAHVLGAQMHLLQLRGSALNHARVLVLAARRTCQRRRHVRALQLHVAAVQMAQVRWAQMHQPQLCAAVVPQSCAR